MVLKTTFFQSQQKCICRDDAAFSLCEFHSTEKQLNHGCFNSFTQWLAVPGSHHFEWYLYPNVLGPGNSYDTLLWGQKVQVCSPKMFSSNFPTDFSGGRGNMYLILCKLETNLYFFFLQTMCIHWCKQCLHLFFELLSCFIHSF